MFFSEKTIILVGIYNQQFQGTIILMVFDLQGIHKIPQVWMSKAPNGVFEVSYSS